MGYYNKELNVKKNNQRASHLTHCIIVGGQLDVCLIVGDSLQLQSVTYVF